MGGGNCNPKDFGAAALLGRPLLLSLHWRQGRRRRRRRVLRLVPVVLGAPPTPPRLRARLLPVLSEDMVKDGYQNIVNIDISSVVIEQMKEKHMDFPQLTYMQLDVRDMSFFGDGSFDCIIDKGTLDAMMCGDDAPHGAYKMLAEVARLMRPGGIYMLITYGAPKERLTLLNQVRCRWEVELYIMPATPEYQLKWSNGAAHAMMEKVALTVDGQLPPDYVLKDPESHFIYVCYKSDIVTEDNSMVAGQDDAMTSF
ncbi:hypothetical protein CFC21_002549 [Triticum aestivum]|uniref:Methyltransferase type 11 domain-containing protein n=1 Tax=Triticum aestivum TaxID=4565 RepID=A0A3B5Y2B0_WHEAT|nr:hypothetical protein CFC21_002549 [Triticum aestivum]